jgi:hypothetical protein
VSVNVAQMRKFARPVSPPDSLGPASTGITGPVGLPLKDQWSQPVHKNCGACGHDCGTGTCDREPHEMTPMPHGGGQGVISNSSQTDAAVVIGCIG